MNNPRITNLSDVNFDLTNSSFWPSIKVEKDSYADKVRSTPSNVGSYSNEQVWKQPKKTAKVKVISFPSTNQVSANEQTWEKSKKNNVNYVKVSSPSNDMFYNKEETEKCAVRNADMAMTTLIQELEAAKKQIRLLNKQINNLNQKEINLSGALLDVAQLKNENEVLKTLNDKYVNKEEENEKGIQHPNLNDLTSKLTKSANLIKEIGRFSKKLETFKTEIGKIDLSQEAKLETLQNATLVFDSLYEKYATKYKSFKERIDTVVNEITKDINDANYDVVPAKYHRAISAKQDLSLEILRANEKAFDETYAACKQELINLANTTTTTNNVFNSLRDQLNIIENRAIFIEKNWSYNSWSRHYGETVRLAPSDKTFFTETQAVKKPVKVEAVIIEKVEEKMETTLEVKVETV